MTARSAWRNAKPATREVLRGLLVTVVLIAAKLYLEHQEIGQRLELLGFEFLQSYLSPFQDKARLPVLVVDISGIGGGRGKVTSRRELMQLLGAIARNHPKAIAVDIDFSPNENGPRSDDDREFFQYCLDLSQRTPILLGVYNARAEAADAWLSWPEYRTLAANIQIPLEGSNKITTRTSRWTGPRRAHDALPVMGFALARAYLNDAVRPPASAFVRLLAEVPDDDLPVEEHGKTLATLGPDKSFLLNYSKLAQIQHEMIATRTPGSVEEFKSFYRGRMVILGDADDDASSDKFNPPVGGATPGVYFHAAGAYTFAVEPLYELKTITRFALDILVSLPIVLVVWLRHRKSGAHEPHSETKGARGDIWTKIDLFYGVVAMLLVVLLGIAFVGWLHIMWTDFVLVLFALPIHRFVERVGGTMA